ncbi:regulatory protein RecX [Oerskovia flava]|uniref:regulatory protein RecX n=1 Tax=Oerskovia flava TaxID=2986422 RepID=UPI00223FE7C2|nr:regulatory protein RecX [Oerskovia sp. JB1-3-2]
MASDGDVDEPAGGGSRGRRSRGSGSDDGTPERRGRRARPTVAELVERGEISPAELAERARETVLRTLTAAPKSRAELAQSLARKGYPEDVVEPLLDRFEEVGLVDDAEYAGMLVRTRHSERGLSRRALTQELRRRGIDEESARDALEAVTDEDEESAAREIVRKRLARTRGLDRQVRLRRLMGTMGRKGYSGDLVMRLAGEELAAEADGADGGPEQYMPTGH